MIKRIINIASARISRRLGRPAAPRLMTYNITDRCNARCVMCEIPGWDTAASSELTVEDFRSFISDPMLRGLEVVRVTGGEPFLRTDLPDFYEAVAEKTRCSIVYITTNGSFPDRVEPLVKLAGGSGPQLHIQVSIDAMDDTHDRLRGVQGMKEKAMETVRRLSELGRRHGFYTGINQTVMKETLNQIEPVSEFARGLGVGHHLFLGAHFHEGKTMSGINTAKQELSFVPVDEMSKSDMESFYKAHRELKKTGREHKYRRDFTSAFLRELSEEYLNEGGRNRALLGQARPKPPCMALFSHFRLTADGRVIACSALRSHSAGSVKDESFSSIWRGAGAGKIRRRVMECKGCWIECDINPSIFYSGDIIPWFLKHIIWDTEFRRNYLVKPRI